MHQITEQLKLARIVPVVVLQDAADAKPLAKALCDGGLPCAEITFRTEAARSDQNHDPGISTDAGRRRNRAYPCPCRPSDQSRRQIHCKPWLESHHGKALHKEEISCLPRRQQSHGH